MPTREELIAQGHTPEEIQAAITQRNLVTMGQNLGQFYDSASGQFNAPQASIPETPSNTVKLGGTSYNDIINKGMTQEQIQSDIQNGTVNGVKPIGMDILQPTQQEAKTDLNAPNPSVLTPPAPVVPPKPEIKAETAKVEPQKTDFNVGAGREHEILSHLNEGFKNAPDLFQNQDAFRASYGYDTADQDKKRLLDAYFQMKSAQQNNPDGIFQQLASGQNIYNESLKNTPSYQQAKKRFDQFNQYKNFDQSQFSTMIAEGKLLEGTQLYNDLASDPAIKQRLDYAQKLNTINRVPVDTGKVVANTLTDIVDNTAIGRAFKDGQITADEMNAMTSTPEIVAKMGDVESKKNEYDKLKAEYDDMENTVRSEMKGKDVTEGYIQAVIGARQKDLFKRLNVASSVYNNALGTLSDMKKAQADLMSLNIELYKEEKKRREDAAMRAEEQKLALEKEMRGYSFDMYKTAQNQDFQTRQDERNFEQQKELADIQNKYQTSRDVQNYKQELEKLGITNDMQIQRDKLNFSQQKELAAIQNRYQNSRDVQNYNMDLNKLQYQYSNDPDKIKQAIENQKNLPLTDMIASFTTTRNGSPNVQCGELVNDYWRSVTGKSAGIGNSLNDKYGAISDIGRSDIPQVGGIFVSNPLKNNIGHTGIVQAVNPDGSITVREANSQGKTGGQPPISKTYSAQQVADMRFSVAPKMKENTQITDKQFTQFNQMYSKFTADPSVKAFEAALSGGGDLISSLKSANGPGDVGAVFQFMKTLDPTSTVREGEFALAAKSAGVWESFKNIPANKLEGTILTEKQRKDFGKLAFEYVKNKSKAYDIKYNDLARVLKSQGIPDIYLPTKMSDYISQFEGTQQNVNVGPKVSTGSPVKATWQSFYNK